MPGDGSAVDAVDVANHVDVGFNQLGVAAAQGGQSAGRFGHDLDGQGVEGDAAVFGIAVRGSPEEVVKLLEGVLLLQHEIGDAHGADADGIGLVALEPGGAGAFAHGGFGNNHRAGALGVFRPVEGEVQAHGLEGDLHLVIAGPLADALDEIGQGHVPGFVVTGVQQLEGFGADAAVEVEVHVVAGDDVAVVGLDVAFVDGEGPDLAVFADGPVLGDRGGKLAAAGAADQGDLEYTLELEVFTFGQQRVELAVADVGDQQVDVSAACV